jgi:hypothetical protein
MTFPPCTNERQMQECSSCCRDFVEVSSHSHEHLNGNLAAESKTRDCVSWIQLDQLPRCKVGCFVRRLCGFGRHGWAFRLNVYILKMSHGISFHISRYHCRSAAVGPGLGHKESHLIRFVYGLGLLSCAYQMTQPLHFVDGPFEPDLNVSDPQ